MVLCLNVSVKLNCVSDFALIARFMPIRKNARLASTSAVKLAFIFLMSSFIAVAKRVSE